MATDLSKLQKLDLNDPHAVLSFAVGPLEGEDALVPQKRGSGLTVSKKYHDSTKTYVIKKTKLGMDDWRCYDACTQRLAFNSHHVGKNPIGSVDVLGFADAPGGEWETLCDVSGWDGNASFSIRPKTRSMHGRQRVFYNKKEVLSVSKRSKIKSLSLTKSFAVSDAKGKETLFVSADLMGRTYQFLNKSDELVALVYKTPKTLFKNAALGIGSEVQMVISKGTDCSAIIAAFFALKQCGAKYIKDAFANFIVDPMKEQLIEDPGKVLAAGTGAAGVLNENLFDGEGDDMLEGALDDLGVDTLLANVAEHNPFSDDDDGDNAFENAFSAIAGLGGDDGSDGVLEGAFDDIGDTVEDAGEAIEAVGDVLESFFSLF